MLERCNNLIRQAMEMARQLTVLADEGDYNAEDDGCHVLYGVIRDCAYKIRAQAKRERETHILKGKWDNGKETETRDHVTTTEC